MKRKYLIFDDLEKKYYSTDSYELFVLMTGYPSTVIPRKAPEINPFECQSKADTESFKKAVEQGNHIKDCGFEYHSRWVKGKYAKKWKRGHWIKKEVD